MRYLANVVTLAYDPSKCTGCARCAEVCPHGVFVMSGPSPEGNRARLMDRDLCMECGACQANCRFGAIRVNSGVGCASAIIAGALRGTAPTCGCSDSGGAAPQAGGCCN
jgi:NAD-dependent dihydropyrimidine dehydrogenase PreA subunit